MQRSTLDDVSHAMMESIERQHVSETRRVDLDNQRLIFDRERASVDDERFNRSQITMERRMNLEERRLEMEKSERLERLIMERESNQQAHEERLLMMEVLKKMADK